MIIGVTIAFIGVARGYSRELGNTLVIIVAIFVLSFLEARIEEVLDFVGERILDIRGDQTLVGRQLLTISFQAMFITIVFASYAGRTLDYGGKPAPPPQGVLLTFAIAILNGYLVAGTLWYYLHKYHYPFAAIKLPLTSTAQGIIPYLPQQLFPTPIYWMFPVALLILLKVKG